MKKYNEFKYELGNDEDGKRAWVKPVLNRSNLSMEQRHADDLNAQFVNSGVKYEEVIEGGVAEAPNGIDGGQQLGAGEPPMAPALSNPETPEAPVIEAPVIPAEPVVEATPAPVVIEETPEAPAENEEGRV